MKASDDSTQHNGNYENGMDDAHAYERQIAEDKALQYNGNRGSSGDHKHDAGHSKGSSVQINGNIGSHATDAKIRENHGK
jgi:hypothetical protein